MVQGISNSKWENNNNTNSDKREKKKQERRLKKSELMRKLTNTVTYFEAFLFPTRLYFQSQVSFLTQSNMLLHSTLEFPGRKGLWGHLDDLLPPAGDQVEGSRIRSCPVMH